ncbi:hypothetical protein CEQ51_02790 [Pseudomonas thivervalensis]|uniref:Uncharacterized protein n=1 Tax=Pseudomonas thivervalensis TaxID=86265 RepID=A0A2Z4ZM69_9PSED|nr:hypothetical protein CE140_03475 [Pseudomonas thivervalensis]AXA59042.1 hypothetical protein CEQ51_02790 [Pseudomonas thivervalensis]
MMAAVKRRAAKRSRVYWETGQRTRATSRDLLQRDLVAREQAPSPQKLKSCEAVEAAKQKF